MTKLKIIAIQTTAAWATPTMIALTLSITTK